jgi:uncharacterized protein (UPF0332 family)
LNEVEKCFNRGLLRKVTPSKEKSELSIIEAKKWLEESIKNKESKTYRSALLTSYLAMFHASRAVLFRDGIREKSHFCIGIYLKSYQVKGLEEKWVILFDRMRSNRHAGQYTFQVTPSVEEVDSAIKSAQEFKLRIEKLLSETLPLKN